MRPAPGPTWTETDFPTEDDSMNTAKRFGAYALLVITAMWVAKVSPAQSPFDGTWHTNMATAKFSPKPIVFYISQGWYHCVSCNPAVDTPADGQDHPVTGQIYDTINVKEVDPKTIAITFKKDGKVQAEQTRTVSADGKTLTVKQTAHPMNSDQPVTVEVTDKLLGIPPSGVHATSGNWQTSKAQESENAVTVTYKTNGDELTMSDPTGITYTAKFDGADYPIKGSYFADAVSLKKVDTHTIEETQKREGKVTEVNTISVSGRTMTIKSENKVTDRTSSFTATKK